MKHFIISEIEQCNILSHCSVLEKTQINFSHDFKTELWISLHD